ncbi:MAG: 2-aminoethylphosphonate--pyruvate transaminase [Planctomycetota bacterium]|jgi:2-aminoethylphosphonate-pyruvate transaminase|nr:2-aminoethylphosphonate--pyruvate transaminase [Planctomycetota bacterium]MDP6763793.1 2-aminoethylphosphonate--pyruvate transaminase [Planctomycetota bacterium]MDP6989005.1 2-aminoethylphosphonate--pyruvate transaminase [Planctomycetota bacterium]
MREDKPLFTPGPLTTSEGVKRAMLRDVGSRDSAFIDTIARIRTGLLELAGVSQADGWEAVLMQGSGTFGIEAVISSALPAEGALLVARNGAYGARIAAIAAVHGIEVVDVAGPENRPCDPAEIERALAASPHVTHVALVHCETTTGIFNPVAEVGAAARRHGARLILDSMSAFGSVELDLAACAVDFLVSSANKCIEGVPGFSFALARGDAIAESEGRARTFSLDLFAQWRGLERDGQFRFTPPTHAILAFEQALAELAAEGGVAGRGERYHRNRDRLVEGMRALGFREYLPDALQGHVITSFRYPEGDRFDFEEFYDRLNARGFVIYPGKVTDAECFRIGSIGRLFEADVDGLLAAIEAVLGEMELDLRATTEGVQ